MPQVYPKPRQIHPFRRGAPFFQTRPLTNEKTPAL